MVKVYVKWKRFD